MLKKYSQFTRTISASFYLIILILIFKYITGDFVNFITDNGINERICFVSGALMLILGNYFIEPYFTKPSDAIVNSISIIIALLGLSSPKELYGYTFLMYYSLSVLLAGIIVIITKDKFVKISKGIYLVIEMLGKSKVIFSLLFLLSIYTYYGTQESLLYFLILTLYWCVLCFTNIVEQVVNRISSVCNIIKNKKDSSLGTAIGCDNPYLYTATVETNSQKLQYGNLVLVNKGDSNIYVGIIICIKLLIDKYQLKIYLLSNETEYISCDKKSLNNSNLFNNSIFNSPFSINQLTLDDCDTDLKDKIENNTLYKASKSFAGYITANSNIHIIHFALVNEELNISEGDIYVTNIQGKKTLYQVINGKTEIEIIEPWNNHGFTTVSCIKLGEYNSEKNELNTVEWLPKSYEPIYKLDNSIDIDLNYIAQHSIGRLPNTNYMIPLSDINSLVTHNTAILGILGIGKSCLAFELIKKVSEQNIKIVIIDITSQYSNSETGLPKYIDNEYIIEDMPEKWTEKLYLESQKTGSPSKPSEWGNLISYSKALNGIFKKLFSSSEDNRVLILDPNHHTITKPLSNFKISELVELTPAEKTRIISEALYQAMMETGESTEAKVWLVLEEAHSLVPEWNSSANPGDSTATNGTARVILQGRKFGLGCLLVTQRTANISKSLLNQCNTVFALRVFDDTGKSFLENYIGSEYANALPSLEERHAIVMGKGMKLKQPLIIRLNNRENCIDSD